MQSVPPHPVRNHCKPKRVCEPLHSYLPFSTNSVVIFFFFFAVFLPLWFQSPHWCQLWEGFLLHGNFFSFTTPSPGQLSILILNPLSLFLSLSFVLPHFEKIGLPFSASGVLCQCSVIFWKLLYIQMNFWCILGGWSGESDLPILFLLHLGSALEEISYA